MMGLQVQLIPGREVGGASKTEEERVQGGLRAARAPGRRVRQGQAGGHVHQAARRSKGHSGAAREVGGQLGLGTPEVQGRVTWVVFEQKISEEQRKPARHRTGRTLPTGAAHAKALRQAWGWRAEGA